MVLAATFAWRWPQASIELLLVLTFRVLWRMDHYRKEYLELTLDQHKYRSPWYFLDMLNLLYNVNQRVSKWSLCVDCDGITERSWRPLHSYNSRVGSLGRERSGKFSDLHLFWQCSRLILNANPNTWKMSPKFGTTEVWSKYKIFWPNILYSTQSFRICVHNLKLEG